MNSAPGFTFSPPSADCRLGKIRDFNLRGFWATASANSAGYQSTTDVMLHLDAHCTSWRRVEALQFLWHGCDFFSGTGQAHLQGELDFSILEQASQDEKQARSVPKAQASSSLVGDPCQHAQHASQYLSCQEASRIMVLPSKSSKILCRLSGSHEGMVPPFLV